MGFKANFCCFCCCPMKPKKFTRAVAILFLVISIILCITNGVNINRVTGAYMATPIVALILSIVTVVYSIIILFTIRKGNWGLVKGYGIFCMIANIISLLLTVTSLVLYMVVAGILGGGNATVLGIALAFAVIPYAIAFVIHAWFIHLSYKVWKGADKMEEKEEEKAKKSHSSSDEEKKNRNYEAHSNNPAYPPPQQQPINPQPDNAYQA